VKFDNNKTDDQRNNFNHTCMNNFTDNTEQIKTPNYHESLLSSDQTFE
jgi:hypothetical protein